MSPRKLPFSQMLSLVLVGHSFAVQAEDRFTVLAMCAAGASHVEQRNCLVQKVKESLGALGAAQRELMTKLRGADQDPKMKASAISAAQADAQEYIAYLGKHCESFAALAYGGNSQQDRLYACRAEMNQIRAEQVSKVAASLP